ncbi:DUF6049 family protein [Antrihabitans cavernicola]|uniref:Glycoprotein n=1 Tax=Antrihabitans cavernicola TaxID=2495913 RepID=A0A5A7SJZ3_9NOCA|nr:DUF6049 family protein [Spelaeibacter cavernicola]KAA0024973.1 glycoprotein [Spelaeibacter cavernicola]
MTGVRKRSAVAVLAALALALLPAGGVATALPNTTHDQPTTSNNDDKFLELAIDSVAPNAVTTTSDPFIVVAATVSNVGDRVVDDVSVRMQRAPAITQSTQLRTSLQRDQENYDVTGNFVTVADKLNAGQKKQFTLTLPLRSSTAASLEISKPGVYPLLLNVNGAPDFGSEARLDDARFLLPVLGVPTDPTAPPAPPPDPDSTDTEPQPAPGAAVSAPTNTPVATTLLWPLADRPRLAPGQPGSLDQKVKLVDDDLATSLGKGGRLDQLVSALEFALRPNVDRDGKLAQSVCMAVDPDLLITVSNMTRGYLVLADKSDPNGATRDGTGAAAASSWLDRVRTLADTHCTLAVPFAQTDLTGVHLAKNAELSRSATVTPADIVDNILATTSKRNIVWPASGALDDDTATQLRTLGSTVALLPGNGVDTDTEGLPATPDLVRLPDVVAPATTDKADPAMHAATYDVSTAVAMAAVGTDPQTPSFTPARARYDLTQDSRAARLQDALGALSWSALTPVPDRTRSLLIAPPQDWGVDGTEASGVLSQVATLLRSGLAVPRTVDDLVGKQPDPRAFQLVYPQQAVDDASPDTIRTRAAEQATRIDLLSNALVADPNSDLTPGRFTAPLREDLLRAMSMSGRTDDRRDASDAAGHTRVGATTSALDGMFKSVTVLAPGGVYTLASEQSPLLLVARNDLPIGIKVKLQIDAPAAMKITDIGEQQLPPRGSRQIQVPAEVNDSRNLTVDVALTTPDGHALGDATTVSVRSNAYGKVLAIITACAGALLLVLAGRRLWHRFRGQPDPADEGFERQ